MRPPLFFLSFCIVTIHGANGFATSTGRRIPHGGGAIGQSTTNDNSPLAFQASRSLFDEFRIWTAVSLFTAAFILTPTSVLADEIGKEREAPTFFTGETVEICVKRGPLGACQKTETRTEKNDNDIAKKYFRDPSDLIKQKEAAMRAESDDAGNALIQKLRQQSIDNQEKNDLYVARKTFEADQSATFGPFDRQVLIMNTDGKTFTMLENPVAMRLKNAGFINDKRAFIKQPTAEDMERAENPEGGGFFGGLFGGK